MLSCFYFLMNLIQFRTSKTELWPSEQFWSTLLEKLPATAWNASVLYKTWKYVFCRPQQSMDDVWNSRYTFNYSFCCPIFLARWKISNTIDIFLKASRVKSSRKLSAHESYTCWANRLARRLAQQVALVCGGLSETIRTSIIALNMVQLTPEQRTFV
jgi:hypothetical protein